MARKEAECHYCGAIIAADDPAINDHWRECEQHPAREMVAVCYDVYIFFTGYPDDGSNQTFTALKRRLRAVVGPVEVEEG